MEAGTFPQKWITGGPNCIEIPDWQIHQYNPDFYILRESGCTNYEKPFLYLIFGKDKVLLEDTGAGKPDTVPAVQRVIALWLQRNQRTSIQLVVTHSHGHGDHIAGDAQFQNKPGVDFISAKVPDIQQAFHIKNWPGDIGQFDLGGRILDVIPTPGHQEATIAFYDRRTGILLTGDSLYPGRLYVRDFPAFMKSTQRLVDFTRGKIIAQILGCHIEESSQPYKDYPVGTMYQPEEHVLQLGRGELLELNDGLRAMQNHPIRAAYRDFTIWPVTH